MAASMNLLAFDTSTEHLSVAVQRADGRRWRHQGPGGAQASAALIPAVQALLAQAGLTLGELRAIVFGCGPGSFTGLRTACSVAQGLAFGTARCGGCKKAEAVAPSSIGGWLGWGPAAAPLATVASPHPCLPPKGEGANLYGDEGVPVLPVDTLLAVAEAARQSHGAARVLALLDARMGELYSAAYAHDAATGWRALGEIAVGPPEALVVPPQSVADGDWVLAGNAFGPDYADRLPSALRDWRRVDALPTADALLDLAPALLAAGHAVPAEQALPLYIRDKVAQTTAERAAAAR